jgi:hypothetical protein
MSDTTQTELLLPSAVKMLYTERRQAQARDESQ